MKDEQENGDDSQNARQSLLYVITYTVNHKPFDSPLLPCEIDNIMSNPDETIVHLSVIDAMGVDMLSITVGLIMSRIDTGALKAAAERVVEKWRLLAGRAEPDPSVSSSKYMIRVPLGPLPKDYRHVSFTEATQKHPLAESWMPSSSSSAGILSPPPAKVFRHAATPSSIKGFCKQKATLLSIHVTHFPEYDCIGFTFCHGIFDGFAMGHILRAVTSEYHGIEWTPLPLVPSDTNAMNSELAALRSQAPLADPLTQHEFICGIESDFVPSTLKSQVKFGASLMYEMLWRKAERRAVYLDADLIAKLVHDVRSGESNRPSTADILLAWLFKAAYSQEPSQSDGETVMVRSAVNMRPYFVELNPAFSEYMHNAFLPTPVLEVTIAELKVFSVKQLAIRLNRKAKEHRNMASFQMFFQWFAKIGGSAMPRRLRGRHSYAASVQTIMGSYKCDFGSGEPLGIWHHVSPLMFDGVLEVYPLRGGFVVDTVMRRSRWIAVEEQLKRTRSDTMRDCTVNAEFETSPISANLLV